MEILLDYLNDRDITVNTLEGAAQCASILLSGDRYNHTLRVVDRARHLAELNQLTDTDRDLLLQAAYLHDVGYSEVIKFCDYHPVDGFTYLRANSWSKDVQLLTLHHTFSNTLAEMSRTDLTSEYRLNPLPYHLTHLFNLLTTADMTSDGKGNIVTIAERVKDVGERHGTDSIVYKHILTVQEYLNRLY